MERSRLRQLLVKYSTGSISEADLTILLDYVAERRDEADLNLLLEEMLAETYPDADLPVNSSALYQRIVEHPGFKDQHGSFRRRYWWYSAAAVVLFATGLFLKYVGVSEPTTSGKEQPQIVRTTTSAPTDKPILRLANGQIVDLDSIASGILAIEKGTQITFDGRAIHYDGDLVDVDDEVIRNTIITPKGRQYQLILPDGSKIWLNAASSITYPVKFKKEAREVEVVGEAYFEVERAQDWPFIVKTSSQHIEVLGTNFNVSAYDDDDHTKTTLVKGSVKVSTKISADVTAQTSGYFTVLKPGQQAVTAKDKIDIDVGVVDTEEAVAWKDNLFVFNNEEISEVMKKVSRWYGIEVEYLDGMAGKRIGGSIPRFEQLEQLMDALQATGVLHYKTEGGVVIIMK